jgi:hypothetical protein
MYFGDSAIGKLSIKAKGNAFSISVGSATTCPMPHKILDDPI